MGTNLDGDRQRLNPTQTALVKGVKEIVPHVGGLQHKATPVSRHEEGLIHLHRLVCRPQMTFCSITEQLQHCKSLTTPCLNYEQNL